ncbi:hypothetical protein ACOSQ4_007289 [Xanthoceras sorbifolium]
MDTREVERLCEALSLAEPNKTAAVLDRELQQIGKKKLELCLAGRLMATKQVNREAFRAIIPKIWGTTQAVEIEILRDIIFGFHFRNRMDKMRILAGGPWSFDRSLLVLEEPERMGNWPIGEVREIDTGASGDCLGKYIRVRHGFGVGDTGLEDSSFGSWMRASSLVKSRVVRPASDTAIVSLPAPEMEVHTMGPVLDEIQLELVVVEPIVTVSLREGVVPTVDKGKAAVENFTVVIPKPPLGKSVGPVVEQNIKAVAMHGSVNEEGPLHGFASENETLHDSVSKKEALFRTLLHGPNSKTVHEDCLGGLSHEVHSLAVASSTDSLILQCIKFTDPLLRLLIQSKPVDGLGLVDLMSTI